MTLRPIRRIGGGAWIRLAALSGTSEVTPERSQGVLTQNPPGRT